MFYNIGPWYIVCYAGNDEMGLEKTNGTAHFHVVQRLAFRGQLKKGKQNI
jgi:hypothetical protein